MTLRTAPFNRSVEISVVVPAHNEEGNIAVLYERLSETLADESWELIVVDDGSTDETYATVAALSRKFANVRGLSLSRNFGHQYALLAGLDHARGDAVISMDADLQHPVELLPQMLHSWREGALVVLTKRRAAEETSYFKRTSSDVFYRFFSWSSGVQIEPGESDFRLLDRRVLEDLQRVDRRNLFLRGLVRWAGYRFVRLPFDVGTRFSGKSKYSLKKMLRLGMTGVTSFSMFPLRSGIALSGVIGLLAAAQFVYAIGLTLTGNAAPTAILLSAAMTSLFALNFLLIGILGLYVSRIFESVQGRPPYLLAGDTELVERGDRKAA